MYSVADAGGTLPLGKTELTVLPAHFMHADGNFHFYDPVSKILFSGDMASSLVSEKESDPVEDFDAHIPAMRGFHQRYMASNVALRAWAKMVRKLDIETIAPQHGAYFQGKPLVAELQRAEEDHAAVIVRQEQAEQDVQHQRGRAAAGAERWGHGWARFVGWAALFGAELMAERQCDGASYRLAPGFGEAASDDVVPHMHTDVLVSKLLRVHMDETIPESDHMNIPYLEAWLSQHMR